MRCCSEQFGFRRSAAGGGFTLIEVVAAVLILSGILATTMVVMNHCVCAAIDLRSHERAFELARENLETLLTSVKVKDRLEYGFDELNPGVQWQLAVEPFYEPISNRMWIRAVSSAEYTDSKGEVRTVELQHWITGLTADQIKQIQAQQKLEEEFLKNLYGEDETKRQELTKAFLEQEGLDTKAYEQFLARQREQKIAYLEDYGYDDGYELFLEDLRQAEDRFLQNQGVNWKKYQDFYRMYLGETDAYMNEQAGGTDASRFDREIPDDLPPEIRGLLEM